MIKQINIVKANGETAPYDRNRLIGSLVNAGTSKENIDFVLDGIEKIIYDGISTKELYRKAFSLLRNRSDISAGRYRLKKAILDMGPTGFPFEQLVGELFRTFGYEAEVGVEFQANCVSHELDVVARNKKQMIMVECKFHSEAGRKSDVKVPLYIHSRFLDVKSKWQEMYDDKYDYQGWVVTNTRFSEDAIKYGKCSGLHLMSWDYPVKGSLKYWIDQAGLHPVTSLHNLRKSESRALLEKNIVLCRQIPGAESYLRSLGIPESRIRKTLDEAEALSEGIHRQNQ